MTKKRILFIDRDGTLITEAPPSYRVDSIEKLQFYPHVFEYMSKIANRLDYLLVMVTNQDGLGTPGFPEEKFQPIHDLIMRSFENEGIVFKAVFIDKNYPSDNTTTRKPGTGMLTEYIDNKNYDLKNSYVIGDRVTDMQLAKNLGCKGIWLCMDETLGASEIPTETASLKKKTVVLQTPDWKDVYRFLKSRS
jgi:imidazoleglycerol-phosphate dehydratase/histidinol-phosphatase